MNAVVNKLLLAGGKSVPKMGLRHTYRIYI